MRSEFGRGASPAEPTPWTLGVTVACALAVFSAGVLVGIFALIYGFSRVAAVAAVLIVAVGLISTLWELRARAVWRWITCGTMIGSVVGVLASVILAFLSR